MNNKYLKAFTVFLSFVLVFSTISPSLASAQTEISELQIETSELQTPIENIHIEENDVMQPMVIGFIARIIIQNGSRILQVLRSGTVVVTHKLIINAQKQGKHILGHKNFVVGKSILRKDADELLKKHAGKGTMINEYKERVDFGEIIGEYYDINSNHYLSTSKGIIHYSNTGAYIVPAAP